MRGNTVRRFRIKIAMGWSDIGFFSEKYRVVAVEAERLTHQRNRHGHRADHHQQRPGHASYRRTISAWKTNCAQRSFGFCAKLVCRFRCLAYLLASSLNSLRHLIRRPSFLPYGDYGMPFQSSLAE